jgi:hypothetical protein
MIFRTALVFNVSQPEKLPLSATGNDVQAAGF